MAKNIIYNNSSRELLDSIEMGDMILGLRRSDIPELLKYLRYKFKDEKIMYTCFGDPLVVVFV